MPSGQSLPGHSNGLELCGPRTGWPRSTCFAHLLSPELLTSSVPCLQGAWDPGVAKTFVSEASSSLVGPREDQGEELDPLCPRTRPPPHAPGSQQHGQRALEDSRLVVPGGALCPVGGDVCLCSRESEDG